MSEPNPIAFTIGNLEVRWYGIIIALAMLIAGVIIIRRSKAHNISDSIIYDILLVSIPAGVIGARLYYVIFNWSYYRGDFWEIINLRGGGLAIHGGLIGGFLACYLMCKYRKVGFLNTLDLAAPAIALAQAIGRWGNYFNSEAHGGPTDLPWAITVMGEKVHPTFLYESIWCFLLSILLFYVDRHRKFTGQVLALYGALYSLERFLVEGLRTDSLMLGQFKQAQVLSLAVIILSVLAYIYLMKKQKNEKGENI